MGVSMSGQTLRQKYMRRFVGLEKHSRFGATLIVGWFISQIVLAVLIGHLLLAGSYTGWGYVGMGALAIFIATRLRGLNNIVHECSHMTFSAHRDSNVVLGSVAASMVLSCYKDYRDEHLTHHAHLGDYDHDLDLQGIKDLKLHDPLTPSTILRHVITPLIGRHLPYYLGLNLSGRDGAAFQALKLGLLIGTGALLLAAPLTAILFVIVPFVFIYSAMNYWTDCMDHAGLLASPDELDASRNILAPTALRVLFFPRHDCYHLVHHLFPHIPARHLHDCHEVLEDEVAYRSKSNATRKGKSKSVRPVEMIS